MRAAAIFSDRMVLQREKPVTVWGEGENGTKVTVSLGGHRVTEAVVDGKWKVILPPMPAATCQQMLISDGKERIVFSSVAIGEVWLCGGQSNMEYEIKDELHGTELLQTLTEDCGVRYYYTPKQRMIDAQFEAVERNTCWMTASPESARAWSAVGLYFALEVAKKLHVTVGLIGCNWGGTSASVWVSRDVLESNSAIRPYIADYDKAMEGKTVEQHVAEFDEYIAYQDRWYQQYNELMAAHPETTWDETQEQLGVSKYPGPMGPKNECRPCGGYETMLQRVCPYTLRGFLYYQGESDDHRPEAYECLLTELIGCWRRDWGDPELPFLNVQLPMFRYMHDIDFKHWCRIREAQERVYRKLKHTGLAVLTDCGELDNIHPKDKAPVGHRLALQALYEVYHVIDREEACAPIYSGSYANGSSFTILTEHAADGFYLTSVPQGFELAGDDGVFYPASAELMPNRIVLRAEEVTAPKYARYAWSNFMLGKVYGRNGLPLAPFRTDCFSEERSASAEKKNTPSAAQ